MCVTSKRNNFNFFNPNLLKHGFWGRNFKNLSADSRSAPPRDHMCQFSVKMDDFEFFWLNLGKLPSYMRYFGSNNAEGDDDMWMHPVTSYSWAEIDHIRLVFFQIRVEKVKRGPSSFQFFVCFDIIRSKDQSQCMILSQRGPPGHASVVLICGLDTKSYRTENRLDPSFLFQP